MYISPCLCRLSDVKCNELFSKIKGKEKQERGQKFCLGLFFFLTAGSILFDAPHPAVMAVNNSTGSSVYVNSPKHLLVESL